MKTNQINLGSSESKVSLAGAKVGARFWPGIAFDPIEDWRVPKIGEVLSVRDPRSWAGSSLFPGKHPEGRLIERHCATFDLLDEAERFVPVLWDTRKIFVRWELRKQLTTPEEDRSQWDMLKAQALELEGKIEAHSHLTDALKDFVFKIAQGVPDSAGESKWNPNHPKFNYRTTPRRDYVRSYDFLNYIWNDTADLVLAEYLNRYGFDYSAFKNDELQNSLSAATGRPVDKVGLRPILDLYIADRLRSDDFTASLKSRGRRVRSSLVDSPRERVGRTKHFGKALSRAVCGFCQIPMKNSSIKNRNVRVFYELVSTEFSGG